MTARWLQLEQAGWSFKVVKLKGGYRKLRGHNRWLNIRFSSMKFKGVPWPELSTLHAVEEAQREKAAQWS
jgi:hypothetical protein